MGMLNGSATLAILHLWPMRLLALELWDLLQDRCRCTRWQKARQIDQPLNYRRPEFLGADEKEN